MTPPNFVSPTCDDGQTRAHLTRMEAFAFHAIVAQALAEPGEGRVWTDKLTGVRCGASVHGAHVTATVTKDGRTLTWTGWRVAGLRNQLGDYARAVV